MKRQYKGYDESVCLRLPIIFLISLRKIKIEKYSALALSETHISL